MLTRGGHYWSQHGQRRPQMRFEQGMQTPVQALRAEIFLPLAEATP